MIAMTETEGVIKYQLDFQSTPVRHYAKYAELNVWRSLLKKLELIGQDPRRYDGLGFGNLSFRIEQSIQFVITGSQTGGLDHLTGNHYCTILAADPFNNLIKAEGAVRPSSEALTHASLYLADQNINAVVHAHSPHIWQQYEALGLPAIPETIQYGTPAMARAVMDLCQPSKHLPQALIVMLGHEDGIIAFGESITSASLAVIKALAAALQLANPD